MKRCMLLCGICVSLWSWGIVLPPGVEVPPEAIRQWSQRFGEDYNLDIGIQAREFLLQSLRRQPELAFQAELSKVDPANPGAEVVFYCQPQADGTVLKRAEVCKAGKIVETYLQNASGHYGVIARKTGKIGEVLLLSACDFRYEPIPPSELSVARFTREERVCQNRPCWEITVEVCYLDDKEMCMQTGFPAAAVADKKSILNTRYPIRRVFVVDQETGFIYSRRHYARNGKRIASCDLKNVKTGISQDPQLFADSEPSVGDFLTRDQFLEVAREFPAPPPSPGLFANAASGTARLASSLNEWFWRNSSIFSMILAVIALGILGLAAGNRYVGRKRR